MNKPETIRVRVTQDQKEALSILADADGMTLSAWVRHQLFKGLYG